MQPIRRSPHSTYLPISFFLLFLLIFVNMRSPSLWGLSILILILISLLAIHFYHHGMRGVARVLLVASGCVASVAVVLAALLFAALWSWWAFGMVALIVVGGAAWLQRHMYRTLVTLFVDPPEHSDLPADRTKP